VPFRELAFATQSVSFAMQSIACAIQRVAFAMQRVAFAIFHGVRRVWQLFGLWHGPSYSCVASWRHYRSLYRDTIPTGTERAHDVGWSFWSGIGDVWLCTDHHQHTFVKGWHQGPWVHIPQLNFMALFGIL